MTAITQSELERITLARVARRLIPFMFLLYVVNILDRVNVTIAVLTMKNDLRLTDEAYGLGVGVFFIGYFFFEVPSNVMLEKLGARLWFARIMLTWGVIASSMMFIRGATSFYALRFLLGVAEAGFFPGMMLYLTYWFPNVARGQAAARFIVANTVAAIIGGPLGAQIMKLGGTFGLRDWQWLFLLEGIPAVILGFAVLACMTDRPKKARWLEPDQREWLIATLDAERAHRQRYHHMTLAQAFRYPRVLHLSALFFLNMLAGAGLGSFANLILKQRTGWSNQEVLWIGTIPNVLGAVALLLAAAHSDRKRDRRMYVAVGLFVAAVGMVLLSQVQSPVLTLAGLSVIAIGGAVQNGPFWALTTGFLSGAAAAGGIAFINSVGNSGSFFGPYLMGFMRTRIHGDAVPILVLAGVEAIAAVVGFFLPPDPAQAASPGGRLV